MKLGNRLGKELVNQPEKCIEHKFDFLFVSKVHQLIPKIMQQNCWCFLFYQTYSDFFQMILLQLSYTVNISFQPLYRQHIYLSLKNNSYYLFLPFLSQKKYPNFKIIHKKIIPGPITKIDTTYFVRSRRHQSQCSCIHKLVLHLWKCKFHHFDTDHDVDKHQLSKLEHPAKNLKCKYYSKVCK